ncbi:MAG TPA: DmsE family decaheme c-type cytochrome [Acidobacteriota bacterium]|nr:DmsE family decaheme c-type cytochrome [Acidobacteriota bacterium]
MKSATGSRRRTTALFILAALVWLPLAGWEWASTAVQAESPATAASAPAAEAAAVQEEAELVGTDTCMICHDESVSVQRTPHATKECEDCHGPGSLHFESGGERLDTVSFKHRDPGWGVGQCQSCHRQDPHLSVFLQSSHGRNNLACVNCHQMHPQQARRGLLSQAHNDLCASCHVAAQAQFRKPYSHPVLEDAMRCVDCHTPHSADLKPQRGLAEGTETGCVSCHSDKSGPFVFEHAPSKVGGCASCHQPHGSVNAKMLNRAQVHQLCLECHSMTAGAAAAQPFSFHDIRSPRFRNCTTCHRQIHGSNADPDFLR